MRFISSHVSNRMPSVLPLLGVSLLPALIVLAMACFSMSREEELVRLPTSSPRPATIRETPRIAVRLTRQGALRLGGEAIAGGDLAAVWQRERAAVRLLGFEPAQATIVVRADREVPTGKVQRFIEEAQAAGFTQCVLRAVDVSASTSDAQGPKP